MNKKYSVLYLIKTFVLVYFFSSCSILKQGQELKTFTYCDFSVKDVNIISIAGVSVAGYDKVQELSMNDYLQLAKKAFSSDIPSELEIEINAKNNAEKRAYISGLDWQLYFMDDLYTEGVISEPVEVLPKQSSSFKVVATVNLLKILHSKSLPELLKLVIEKNSSIDLSELDVTLKVKPWYQSGSNIKTYPGYISIKP
jgi:hypothetical protein